MWCAKYPQTQHIVVCNQERSETQLHTTIVSEAAKTLGFTRSLLNVACMGKRHFSIAFQGLMESVQPNLRCD